jgi:hypothetical protein
MQLGFDLEFVDPVTCKKVEWAEYSDELARELQTAPWKVVDIETTGLNPASKKQTFSGRDYQRGVNPALRVRVLTVLFPRGKSVAVEAFDFDTLTPAQRQQLVRACLSEAVFGHNVGFDAYWLRTMDRAAAPRLLLDSMLIARTLYPEQPLTLMKMAVDEDEEPELQSEARAAVEQKRSGWSLADLVLTLRRKVLSKKMQGPRNWCEPFLTQEAYDYATTDARETYQVLKLLLESDDGDILAGYLRKRDGDRVLQLLEPQVWDVVRMREHGLPWSIATAEQYVQAQWQAVRQYAARMVELEPALKPFEALLADATQGVKSEMKRAIGKAFMARGILLETTEAKNEFKVGEKDLRRAKAQVGGAAKELFDAWAGLNRAKKAGGMANEVTGFALRSPTGRVHSNKGHGPVTGRLAASEPNDQQFPRDPQFRACVAARPGYKIVASDYSALDMRVGAALAIRAQRHIVEAYLGARPVEPDVRRAIAMVFEGKLSYENAVAAEAKARQRFDAWKDKREKADQASAEARKAYWQKYREYARSALLCRFARCLAYVRKRARAAGTAEWGSLRDAFSIPGMDIHTWTTLGMVGNDPSQLFAGMSNDEVVAALKRFKKELGDKRQTGKVGNLSLTYAMQTQGLMDAAAKNYNIHWTYEEADKVRSDWFRTYVEIDLWHAWKELTPDAIEELPDPERGMRVRRTPVYRSFTLAGRCVYAFGLNAALSYEDQSTGADILGDVMHTLSVEHPAIFDTIVNQVHDEVVFEVPADKAEAYTNTICEVMTRSAEKYLAPYGVRSECTPAVGDVWLKD